MRMREVTLGAMATLAALIMVGNMYMGAHFWKDIVTNNVNGKSLAIVTWLVAAANEHLFFVVVFTLLAFNLLDQYEVPLWVWGSAVFGLKSFSIGLVFWEFRASKDVRH